MLAKRFFYVCAGILCLSLGYRLGLREALGQDARVECAAVGSLRYAVVGRYVFSKPPPPRPGSIRGDVPVRLQFREPIPGTSRVVACGDEVAILENGEIWLYRGKGWKLEGNFLNSTR